MMELAVDYALKSDSTLAVLDKIKISLASDCGATIGVKTAVNKTTSNLVLNAQTTDALHDALLVVGPLLTQLDFTAKAGRPTYSDNIPALLKSQFAVLAKQAV